MWQQTYARQRFEIEWCENQADQLFLSKYRHILSVEEREMYFGAYGFIFSQNQEDVWFHITDVIGPNISSRCHRHRLDFIPAILRLRISDANIGPNLCHQYLTASWLTSMPRSCSKSSTLRRDSGNRTYSITARRMISGLVLK